MIYLHPENYIVPEKTQDQTGRDLDFAEKIIRESVPVNGDPNGADSMLVKDVISLICGQLDSALRSKFNKLTSQRESIKKLIRIEENKSSPDVGAISSWETQSQTLRNSIRDLKPPRIRKDNDGNVLGLARAKRLVQNEENVAKAQGCESLRRSEVKKIVLKIRSERRETWVYPNEEI